MLGFCTGAVLLRSVAWLGEVDKGDSRLECDDDSHLKDLIEGDHVHDDHDDHCSASGF